MKQFFRKVKSNFFPFIIAAGLLLACSVAWYLNHPASPYHKRYTFVVSYEAIGTLSPGNRVEVRGITKGKITKVELTEDAVFVTAQVLSDTKIPRNSEFRLITSGLMGEREMCVLSGDSKEYIADGDTVRGLYDKGTSGISKDLFDALESLNEIKDKLIALKDTVTVGSIGKRTDRVVSKGKNLLNSGKSTIGNLESDVDGILSKCRGMVDNGKGLLESVSTKVDGTVENVESVVSNLEKLLDELRGAKAELDQVTSKLDDEDNTAGLVISGKGRLIGEIDHILVDIEKLIADIKKTGLKLNVDIF